MFCYEINVFLDEKTLAQVVPLGEYKWVMQWKLTYKYFGTNIHRIYRFDNTVYYMTISIPTATKNLVYTRTTRNLCHANASFNIKINKAKN